MTDDAEQPESDHDLLVRIADAVERIAEELGSVRHVVDELSTRDPYDD